MLDRAHPGAAGLVLPSPLTKEVLARRKIGFLWGYYQQGQRSLFRQATASKQFLPVIFTHEKPELFAGYEALVAPLKRRRLGGASSWPKRFLQKYLPSLAGTALPGRRLSLEEMVRSSGVELLHVFQGNKAIKALSTLKRLPLPITVSFHGNDLAECLKHSDHTARLPELFDVAVCVMGRSLHMNAQLEEAGCPPGKLWLNRAGIPVERFPFRQRRRLRGEPLHLIQACRLIPKKGLFDTVAAIAEARQQLGSRLTLAIAGEGELRPALEEKIDKLHLQNAVQLLGFLDEAQLVEALGRAHVYLQPSVTTDSGDQEGIPNAMLEAMLTGLPPITTRHAGIPEAVTEGQTGWLVGEHDVKALAARISWCAEHPEEVNEIGRAAHDRVVEEFSLDSRAALLDAKYAELIAAYPSGNRKFLRKEERKVKRRTTRFVATGTDPQTPRIGYLWGRPKPEERCIVRQITAQSGFESVVFARSPVDLFEREGVRVVTFDGGVIKERKREGVSRRTDLDLGLNNLDQALLEAVESEAVSLLHVFYGDKAIAYLPALQRLKIPVTVSFHGVDLAACLNDPRLGAELPRLFEFAALLMARSDYMADKLRTAGCPTEKVYVNRTGIPLDRFPFSLRQRSPNDPVIYLQTCRLIPKKGLFDSLAAFEMVRKVISNAQLWVAGKGELEGPLSAEVENRGLAGPVRLLGYLGEAELLRALLAAHVFIHPSITTREGDQEGIPNAMLEAMATGLVPITTRHAGIPEAVVNGLSGWLVNEADTGALAERMIWCAHHPVELAEMSPAARGVVEADYDSGRQARKLAERYLGLLRPERELAAVHLSGKA